MRFVSSSLLSVVLAVTMLSAGVAVDRLTNVYVTNFPLDTQGNIRVTNMNLPEQNVTVTNLPLDEQGNLKITDVPKSKTVLVFNQTVTVPSDSNYYYLTSFNTSGFKYYLIMAKGARGAFQSGANVNIFWYNNNFGIRTFPAGVGGMDLLTSDLNDPRYGCGIIGSIGLKMEAYAPIVDLYLRVYNSNIGFNGLLMIAVYLTTN